MHFHHFTGLLGIYLKFDSFSLSLAGSVTSLRPLANKLTTDSYFSSLRSWWLLTMFNAFLPTNGINLLDSSFILFTLWLRELKLEFYKFYFLKLLWDLHIIFFSFSGLVQLLVWRPEELFGDPAASDWRRVLREILISGGQGPTSQGLLRARCPSRAGEEVIQIGPRTSRGNFQRSPNLARGSTEIVYHVSSTCILVSGSL